ncbi:MAG: hypothetical protein EAZ57_01505 [Cytophagales bacterium]|nr:MAG: hypothetical protein EAZ67_01770 [Cytophagales bacterium]TAF62126.1 MAG: hypothetical protein EAZ57_01505 [Cytophagales bacterium]
MTTDNSQIIKATAFAEAVYGLKEASLESWKNYAFSLMVIAGADGLSVDEFNWLLRDIGLKLTEPDPVIAAMRDFDYKKADLRALISKIYFFAPLNLRRALLYDAVRMSKADLKYSDEEQLAVEKAAKFLNLKNDIALEVEGLIDMEVQVHRTKIQLFEADPHAPFPLVVELVSSDMILDYGKALLIIAGADGDVSEEELLWFIHDFAIEKGVEQRFIQDLRNYDYHSEAFEDVIARIKLKSMLNLHRILLYDSIKLARSDNNYAFEEEAAVKKAARTMNIDMNLAISLERLVETENMIIKKRKKILEN